MIEDIIGCKINVEKDKNQRKECGCVESVEVGCYNTCFNVCKYCYANYSKNSVKNNYQKYDVNSPLLCSVISDEDKISERKLKSLKDEQISFLDIADV